MGKRRIRGSLEGGVGGDDIRGGDVSGWGDDDDDDDDNNDGVAVWKVARIVMIFVVVM